MARTRRQLKEIGSNVPSTKSPKDTSKRSPRKTAQDFFQPDEDEQDEPRNSAKQSEDEDNQQGDDENDQKQDEQQDDESSSSEQDEDAEEASHASDDDDDDEEEVASNDEDLDENASDDGEVSNKEDSDVGEEEMELEEAVFGFSRRTKKLQDKLDRVTEQFTKAPNVEDLFVVDKGIEEDEDDDEEDDDEKGQAGSSSVWQDDDDAKLEVDLRGVNRLRKLRENQAEGIVTGLEFTKRLRAQHEKFHDTAKWAQVPATKKLKRDDDDEENDDEKEIEQLLRSSEGFTVNPKHMHTLPPGRISIGRLNDANQHGASKAVLQAMDWHRGGQLFVTAGFDKTARIFKIDGKTNAKVDSVFLQDMPIFDIKFAGRDHEQLICCGRRKYFYWIDLESGEVGKVPGLLGRNEKSLESMAVSPDGSTIAFLGYDGNVLLVSQKTKQLIGTVKMNENGSSLCFTGDGQTLYSGGRHGKVYCWDMRTRRLRHQFQDQGNTNVTSLAVTADNSRIATGSPVGIVNLYDVHTTTQSRKPVPLKEIDNLTTRIDQLTFNHDGQILAFLSRRKKDQLRLLNCNTLTAVPNWPTGQTPIAYGSSVAFSPGSAMLTIGNDKGRCLLYRLHHFNN